MSNPYYYSSFANNPYDLLIYTDSLISGGGSILFAWKSRVVRWLHIELGQERMSYPQFNGIFSVLLCNALLMRIDCSLRTVINLQLVENICNMKFYGFDTDKQLIRNFLIGHPLRYPF